MAGEMRVDVELGLRMESGCRLEDFHCCGEHFRGPKPNTVDQNLLGLKGPVLSVLIRQLGIGTALTNPVGRKAGTGEN